MGNNGKNGKQQSPMPGRTPLLFVPAIRGAILEALANSMPIQTAAALCKISEQSIKNWVWRGRQALERREAGEDLNENDAAYADFFSDALQARASAIKHNIGLIRGHATHKWEAAKWLLEKGEPRIFASTARVELVGAEDAPAAVTTVDLTKLSAEELRALQALVAKAKPDAKALPNNGGA